MSLEVAIAENTAALRALLAQLQAAPVVVPVAAPVEAPKPKAERKPKAEPVAVAEPAPAPVPVVEATLGYDDVRGPFLQLVAKHGRDAGVGLLQDFGVPVGGKLTDVPADKWGAVLAETNRRLAQ